MSIVICDKCGKTHRGEYVTCNECSSYLTKESTEPILKLSKRCNGCKNIERITMNKSTMNFIQIYMSICLKCSRLPRKDFYEEEK